MSHGTAAPAPGRAAGNGLPAPGGLPASRGLPLPGGVPADGGRPGSAPPAVRVRGVRRSFEAEFAPVRALRGLDLDVAAGEFVAVMGPSGCGKSTLLNVIAGLDRPDEGSVEVAASGSTAATRSGWPGSAGSTSASSSSSSACSTASACWTTWCCRASSAGMRRQAAIARAP